MDDDDILSTEDLARVLRSVVEQAGPNGLPRPEATRRGELMAKHVRDWKVSAAPYSLFDADKIRIRLNDDESDIHIVLTEDVTP